MSVILQGIKKSLLAVLGFVLGCSAFGLILLLLISLVRSQ